MDPSDKAGGDTRGRPRAAGASPRSSAAGRAALGLALALGAWGGCAPRTHPAARWEIALEAPADRIVVEQGQDTVTFDIESAKGIGAATLEYAAGQRPRTGWLCFHLHGLEELRCEYDSTRIVLSLSHTDPPRMRQQLTQDGAAPRELHPEDAPWLDWRVESTSGLAPTAPERIWIAVPADFLRGRVGSLRLRWIDFYR